ncbi:alginate export family protein [Nitrosomonas sp. PY1]|uniref:alginate export family protein n=1 Tax=Nitrosomonas sp. PY1 TaxID=1803906 RepID=UPI001FC7F68B|nr:alginate export family protein [Nitrosomonas sp. PY1]GKS68923.1 alginate export family protein [Nitrosomonas sp. PY1]
MMARLLSYFFLHVFIIAYGEWLFIDRYFFINSANAKDVKLANADQSLFLEEKLSINSSSGPRLHFCCKEDKQDELTKKGANSFISSYKSLRYQEDYRYLRNSPRNTDFWNPIKYISLNNQEDWYLSIGGEMRQRYEFYHNEKYGKEPADPNGNSNIWLQRYMLHGDLHLGANIRVFAQFMSTFEDWRKGGPRPDIDENAFDLHQGFMDLTAKLGSSNSVTLRFGRQEIEYGSGRLISGREVPNNRRSFDAIKLLFILGDWSIDGFVGKPVRNLTGVFDDDRNPNKSLWGAYAIRVWPLLPDGHVDLYYLGYDDRHAIFAQGRGHEVRHTVGARIWGNPFPWKYNFEFVGQFGQFGSNDIRAWAAASDTHYNFSQLPLNPQIGMRADITSGDGKSSTLGTYNPLFPTGAYFNLADLGGPPNFIHIHPSLNLSLTEKLKASFDWGFFWRQNVNDAIYSIATVPIFSPISTVGQKHYSGSSPSFVLTWEPISHITVVASYVHFFPSDFLKTEYAAKEVDYFTTWVTYKF